MKILNLSLLLTIVVFASLNSQAQILYEYNQPNRIEQNSTMIYLLAGNYTYFNRNLLKTNNSAKFTEVDLSVYEYKNKGKRSIEKKRVITKFNKHNQKIEEIYFKDAKELYQRFFKYNDDKKLLAFKSINKGKLGTEELIYRNDDNRIVKYKRFKKGKLISKVIVNYNDSLISSQYSYWKDTLNIRNKWEYEYYKTGEKKTTRKYRKGKLEYTWNYKCDDEGVEIKSKSEKSICKLKQYNADSTYVIIKRTTGKDGEITKKRWTYNKYDKLILTEYIDIKGNTVYKDSVLYDNKQNLIGSYTFYPKKNINKIRSSLEYKYSDNGKINERSRKNFNTSGEVQWEHFNKYNDMGKTLESFSFGKNKKIYRHTINTYNQAGIRLTSVTYGKKKEIIRKEQSKYTKDGLLSENLYFDKGGILKRKTLIKYQFATEEE
jgi:hypothetical protein